MSRGQRTYYPPVSIGAVAETLRGLCHVRSTMGSRVIRNSFLRALQRSIEATRREQTFGKVKPSGKTEVSPSRVEELTVFLFNSGFLRKADDILTIVDTFELPSRELPLEEVSELIGQLSSSYDKYNWFQTRTRYRSGGESLHLLFSQQYIPYSQLILLLEQTKGKERIAGETFPGLSEKDIIDEAPKQGYIVDNLTKVENMLRWGQYFGSIGGNMQYWGKRQPRRKPRPSESGRAAQVDRPRLDIRYYLISQNMPTVEVFEKEVRGIYGWLSSVLPSTGQALPYVDLVTLREFVCERLQMHREAFDEQLIEVWKSRPGEYEFVRSAEEISRYGSPAGDYQLAVVETGGFYSVEFYRAPRRSPWILPPLTVGETKFYYVGIRS